jgi:hypothetical protein
MKLYNAFHENRLNAMDCKACAVGNLCDNTEDWTIYYKSKTGYTPNQLRTIEHIFMFGNKDEYRDIKDWNPSDINSNNQDLVFQALCQVVEYLAELDNIPNPMDYTKLFETENDKPKYQLV